MEVGVQSHDDRPVPAGVFDDLVIVSPTQSDGADVVGLDTASLQVFDSTARQPLV